MREYAAPMPWLPAFADVFAAVDAQPADAAEIDDPVVGRFAGTDALARYVASSAAWTAAYRPEAHPTGRAACGRRAAAEFEVTVRSDAGARVLPVAMVVDAESDRGPVARVYLSMWTVTGERIPRARLVSRASDSPLPCHVPPTVVADYVAALAAGDVERCISCYEPDGALQGGGGPAHAIRGVEQLRPAYEGHLADGGIVLEPASFTVDLPRIAMEFTLRAWGSVALDQAGVSVYTLGPTGRIAWNRVYDDAARPAVSSRG
jgi:hypothetical protein